MVPKFTIQDINSRCDDITSHHQALLPFLLSDLCASTFMALYDSHRGEITTEKAVLPKWAWLCDRGGTFTWQSLTDRFPKVCLRWDSMEYYQKHKHNSTRMEGMTPYCRKLMLQNRWHQGVSPKLSFSVFKDFCSSFLKSKKKMC